MKHTPINYVFITQDDDMIEINVIDMPFWLTDKIRALAGKLSSLPRTLPPPRAVGTPIIVVASSPLTLTDRMYMDKLPSIKFKYIFTKSNVKASNLINCCIFVVWVYI